MDAVEKYREDLIRYLLAACIGAGQQYSPYSQPTFSA